MDEYKDNLVITMLGRKDSDKSTFDQFKGKAQAVAMKNSIPITRIYLEFVKIEETPIAEAFKSLVNAHDNGSAVLVIGAAGKGNEDSRRQERPDGQPPMGSIAMTCLERCKVPVVLVKSGKRIDLDQTRIKRAGRDETPGLNMMVALDASAVSRVTCDMAISMTRHVDSIYGFHVIDTGSVQSKQIVQEYSAAFAKLAENKACALAQFETCEKQRSVRDHIDAFVDDKAIDIIFMGSTELSMADKSHFLGSISSAVTKTSIAHCCVVKNFATT